MVRFKARILRIICVIILALDGGNQCETQTNRRARKTLFPTWRHAINKGAVKGLKKDVYDSSFPSVSSCGDSDGGVCVHQWLVFCFSWSLSFTSGRCSAKKRPFSSAVKRPASVFTWIRSFLFAVCLQAEWKGHAFTPGIIIRTDAFLPSADTVKRLL